MRLDVAGFERELEAQRTRARASWKAGPKEHASEVWAPLQGELQSAFEGYGATRIDDVPVLAIVREDGTAETLAEGEEGEIVLEVADTGVGIPENEKELVFDFAYSTREGGTGLGLAMVHQYVVDDHGGRVTLESSGGEGTVVRLVFPPGPGEEA